MLGTSRTIPLERRPWRAVQPAGWFRSGPLVAAVALTVAGCGQFSAFGFDDAGSYRCLEHTIAADTLAAATPVADLTGDAATMLSEAQWDDGQALSLEDEDAWYVAAQSEDSILIMRTLAEDEVGKYGLPGSDHEVIQVSRFPSGTKVADGWYVMANSYCPLTIDLGGLSVPTVALIPAHMPDPASSELQLAVTETACNSGQPADGRVKLVSLIETEDSVTVTIGVVPQSGSNTCPSNPATPFTVSLDAPIGDRTIIDGTRGVPLNAP